MKFTKMHGIGNDYVYINCFKEKVKNISELAKFVSDRHLGIGSDGLVLICKSETCDYRMRMFNSDGSEAEMCGNAIRCVGKYVYDNNMTNKTRITIETLGGVKTLDMEITNNKVVKVKVDMGQPILESRKIPINSNLDRYINQPIKILDKTFNITGVSMGNPHAIAYIDDVANFELKRYGSVMEVNELFPKKVNSEFVRVIDKNTLEMRVYERGAGETMACGTGACAVLVASVLNNLCERKATIKLLGGDLIVEWNENDNHVYMTGGATFVFEGELKW